MEDKKKLSPWKKILVVLILAVSVILVSFFMHSCNRVGVDINVSEIVGSSYFSAKKNYILNFVTEELANYIDESKEESALLSYTIKDNVVYLEMVEEKAVFVILTNNQILYQKVNIILFRMEQ
ncbi:MAG: hypothetical protein WCS49_03215 [Bacilli bacterium]